MIQQDLITVAIPIYNAEKFLENAIQSVLNQTYKNIELLLIDDGSTDSSLIIAKQFNDDRITVISDGENKGLIYRLNQSISLSNGKYYARMDADDIMYVNRLEIQYQYLENNKNVDLLGSSVYLIDTSNNIYGRLNMLESPKTISDINKHQCFIHPTVMGLTSWFKANTYSSEAFRMEDYELWKRTISSSVFKNITNPLFFYREAGLATKQKYLNGYKTNRMYIRRNNNLPHMIIKLVNNYAKQCVIILLDSLNLLEWHIRHRAKRTYKDINNTIQQELINSIKRT